ncbi:Dolichyl-phosphate-mannose-protein mannosyltransferase, putative [Trichomonas vaginalis G3]|uniref:Dolichyl-phosphate-mannose-protein mannosyltransferase, putative n=1 Tax=Trichomonas vaginalis (strain ATCC PRA-98 / G3) TaxID=412133 RepID=A2FLM0_TRIV3|nr:dolichyl-phosphate-mannose-protein mannosyltransferase protein [Trichomonas vaginalis G3]EAX94193.1 Dolichyl-phosphate-mannose-protein mannosyltransferase, putative [Trichomonas vaginalis G3]KAI5498406.1 dolichyl-phosphate-mannose-protein mannosyltransferase protein [Trichomonas vaginalis G3]|eukprot:XP_001307123.1 Dolichyl-phosphate-mannose-protein mannosyltransferase [Trichomonas vaginalis G3]
MEDSSSSAISNSSGREHSDNELPRSLNIQSDGMKHQKRSTKSILKEIIPTQLNNQVDFVTSDVIAVVFFIFVGVFLRAFRIYYPNTPVFDEVHFGTYINNYMKGTYFTDIHPPLPKLIMAFFAYLGNYNGDIDFKKLQETKAEFPTFEYATLRLVPAVLSGLVPVFTFLTVKFAHLSSFSAFTCACFASLDQLLITESRLYVTDGILHLFSIIAIFSIFVYENYPSIVTLIAQSLCIGLAISSKLTAGGLILLALFRQFQNYSKIMSFTRAKDAYIRCLIIIAGASVVLFSSYYVHLSILPYEPVNATNIPDCIRDSLVSREDPKWHKRFTGSSFLWRIVTLLFTSQKRNLETKKGHPYASKWYSWPLVSSNWLLYWISDDQKHYIACAGNPFLWPILFGFTLFAIISVFLTNDRNSSLSLFVYGYLFSYLPFILIRRDTFLYHYSIPLIFSMMICVCITEMYIPPKIRSFLFSLFISLSLLGFMLFACWCYGLTVPDINFLVFYKHWLKLKE